MSLVSEIPPNTIHIGERLRPLSEPAVMDILHSIQRVGQIQPITVVQRGENVRLVTGHHRLVAARRLSINTASAKVLPESTTDDECMEIEIAENLHRSDLTKDERDRHIRFLAQIIDRQAAEVSSQNAAKPKSGPQGGRPQGVVSKVAEKTGLSPDTVRRALNPEEEAAKKAEKEAARQRREEEQVEHDRQREEFRATLPENIQAGEAAREANRQKARDRAADTSNNGLTAEDKIAELEEAVSTLKARITELEAENKFYGEMKVQWSQDGYDKVVADLKEDIRVARERFHNENAEKIKSQKSRDWWKQRAIDRGYKPDVQTVDMQTGELRDA